MELCQKVLKSKEMIDHYGATYDVKLIEVKGIFVVDSSHPSWGTHCYEDLEYAKKAYSLALDIVIPCLVSPKTFRYFDAIS
mgnify:CR=1 FL=1